MPSPSIPSTSSIPRYLGPFLRVLLALLLLSGAIAVSPPCLAAEADDVQRAREHHKAGDQAFKDGRYLDAYKEWEAGFNLSPRPLFLLNMAHAERRRGELKNARTLYRRFLLMEPQTKLRGEVESVLAEIDAALAEAPVPAPAAQPEAPPLAPPEVTTAPPPPELLGSPNEPPSGPPPFVSTALPPSEAEPTARPLYKQWWFWTGIGVVAAAAGGTSFFLLRGPRYTKMGSLGTVGAP
jgi:hypothetical protein